MKGKLEKDEIGYFTRRFKMKEKKNDKIKKFLLWGFIIISLIYVVYSGGLEVKSIPIPDLVV